MSDWHLASKNIPQKNSVLSATSDRLGSLSVLLASRWVANQWMNRKIASAPYQSISWFFRQWLKAICHAFPHLPHTGTGEKSDRRKISLANWNTFCLASAGKEGLCLVGKMWFPGETENCTCLLVQVAVVFALKFHPIKCLLFEPEICGFPGRERLVVVRRGKAFPIIVFFMLMPFAWKLDNVGLHVSHSS